MRFINEYVDLRIVGAVALLLAIVSCGGSNKITPPGPPSGATYIQVERWGRSLTKEVFENYNDHQTTNQVDPTTGLSGDSVLANSIVTFSNNFRAPQFGKTLQAILIPDMLQADLSQSTTTAAFLGVETGGATGSKFGGRALTDDVTTIYLQALFGKTLVALGLVPDDNKEAPCLEYQNVVASSAVQPPGVAGNAQFADTAALAATKGFSTSSFPYLGKPY